MKNSSGYEEKSVTDAAGHQEDPILSEAVFDEVVIEGDSLHLDNEDEVSGAENLKKCVNKTK